MENNKQHQKMDHSKMNHKTEDHSKMDHSKMKHDHGSVPMGMAGHDHHQMMINDFKNAFG